jgi:hypothetical protein
VDVLEDPRDDHRPEAVGVRRSKLRGIRRMRSSDVRGRELLMSPGVVPWRAGCER